MREMSTRTITILLADDHPVVRDGLAAMLATEPDFHVVGVAETGAEAMRGVTELRPDIVLLDLEMPSGNGIEVIERLREAASAAKVIVFTAFDQDEQIMAAIRAGAQGYLLKGAPRQELFRAIRTVMAGEYWIGREAVGDIVEFMRLNASGDRPPKNFGLTKREMDILTTIVAGLSNKEIARKFALSEDTVKHHLTNIFDKVGVQSRLELALFAINNRITDQ